MKNRTFSTAEEEISEIMRRGPTQSVRTTFRLTKEGSEAMSWLAKKHKIKPKLLIQLCAAIDTRDSKPKEGTLIYSVLKSAKDITFSELDRSVRKTFVVSKESLGRLNKISKTFNIPRDLLVETLARNLESGLKRSMEEKKKQHKKALEIINKFFSQADEIEKELKEFLKDDDPILERFGIAIVIIMNLCSAIESELEEGTPIDPDIY